MRNRTGLMFLTTAALFFTGFWLGVFYEDNRERDAPATTEAPKNFKHVDPLADAKAEYDRLILETTSDARDQVIGPKAAVCESYWRYRNFSRFAEANKNLDFGVEPVSMQGVLQAKANGFAMTVIAAVKGGVTDFGCHEGAPNDDYEGLEAASHAVFASGGLLEKIHVSTKEFRQLLVSAARRRACGLVLQFGNDLGAEFQVKTLLDEFTQEELGLSDAVMRRVSR